MATLIKWEPFVGLSPLRWDMDRLFEHFFEGAPQRFGERSTEPAVEVSDTPETVLVRAQVPGMSKDTLQVHITEDRLTLKGELKAEEKKADKNYYRQEFRYGTFTRTIALPGAVQAENATAQLKDGVLEIHLPKSAQAKVQHIPVSIA